MISFKFQAEHKPGGYARVQLFAGEDNKTHQLAGELMLKKFEWDKLRQLVQRNLPEDGIIVRVVSDDDLFRG